MSKKKKNKPTRYKIGNGNLCVKCKVPMERRGHPKKWEPREKQAFYFAWWDVCKKCQRVQHYEEAKRYVCKTIGTEAKAMHRQPSPVQYIDPSYEESALMRELVEIDPQLDAPF